MADVTARGVRFHVQRLGAASPGRPPVVFLHGLVMDNLSSFYFTLANPVAQLAEVILYDLRGHGRSERPASGYGLADMVADLAAVLDAIGAGPVVLVGNSFGGLLALAFAAAHPERARGVVLIDGHLGEQGWTEKMAATLELEGEERDRKIATSFEHWLGRHSERKSTRLARSAAALVYETSLVRDLRASTVLGAEDLRAVRCPVLALYGESSDLRAEAERISVALPSSVLRVFPGCSHSILWEATAEVRDAVLAFVASRRRFMGEEIAHEVGPARLDVAYERFGDPRDPPVLLFMGIGAQMIAWPDGFCEALVARGLHVVRFDNRDAGRSTHFPDAPAPDLRAALAGDVSSASYTLSDLAADTVGLMDALGFASAHLVGASMGGMIAQVVAIEHPCRVRSLTSMMATTGDPSVGQAAPDVLAAVFRGPLPATREEAMGRAVERARVAGSPAFPLDEEAVRDRAGREFDRDHDPVAVARLAFAVVATGDRTARLRTVDVPTLVLHGAADRLCDPSGGRATAAAIPGAELVLIDGMGHHLPRPLWPRVAELVAEVVRRGEARVKARRA